MIKHIDLGQTQRERIKKLAKLIRNGEVSLGGYSKGKIYGLLSCASGKRMKTENRVFFISEEEALHAGFRPCGNCMREKYNIWKTGRYE